MSRPPLQVPLDTYWGIIQAGARARQTTAALWLSVRYASEVANEVLGPGSFQRMNQLRALAGSQIRADAALARLTADQTIGADHIASDINSRDQAARNLTPRYRVAFDVTGTEITTGARTTLRLTDTFGRNLPATRGNLEDALSIEAPAMGEAYGFLLEPGVSNVSIREV